MPQPLPPPTAEPDDEPLFCISLNNEWITYVLGALKPMRYPEYWGGTLEENRHARKMVANLIERFLLAQECGDMTCCNQAEMTATLIVRTRVTVEGHVQISVDNGTTWKPSPNDPSVLATQMPPPTQTSSGGVTTVNKCLMAGNILDGLKGIKEDATSHITTTTTLIDFCLEILTVALEFMLIAIGEGLIVGADKLAALVPLIIGFARTWWHGNVEEWEALWTDTVWDKTLCHIYCNIPNNGDIDQTAFNNIVTSIDGDDTIDTKAKYALTQWLKIWNSPGINTVAANGLANYDCSDCACACNTGMWDIFNGAESYGQILDVTDTYIDVRLDFAPSTVGSYFVRMKTPNVDSCCVVTKIDILSGVAATLVGFATCGTPQTGSSNLGGTMGSGSDAAEVNMLYCSAPSASDYRIHFQTT